MLKAYAMNANPAGDVLNVQVRQTAGHTTLLNWTPTITTSSMWFETTFTPTFSTDTAELFINGLLTTGSWGACQGFVIDEIYIYEDIPADRLLISNHEFNDGQITSLYGCRCDSGRTSFNYGGDSSSNLISVTNVDKTETVLQTFTSSNYPMWELNFTAMPGVTYEAGAMFIGPKMDVEYLEISGFDPHGKRASGTMQDTMGGKDYFTYDYERGVYEFGIKMFDESVHDDWVEWWEEVGRNKYPFFFCWDETSHPEDVKMVRCDSAFQMPLQIYGAHYRMGKIRLKEVI